MKRTAKGYVAGLLTGFLLFSTVMALANASGTMREIFFGINVVVDGVPQDFEYDMRPFITEGRTFLPVRGIADALGLPVHWEGSTQTVYIGNRPAHVSWLDQMGHRNHQTSFGQNGVFAWVPGTAATDGTIFDRGIVFGTVVNSNVGESTQSIEFILNGNYNVFRGTYVDSLRGGGITEHTRVGAQFRIYGDGVLLGTSPIISHGMIPADFNIDITNVQTLKILVESTFGGGFSRTSFAGIVNARFESN